MNTDRAETFSDESFAIAITLRVRNIHVPDPGSETGLAFTHADQ